ncbi:hypothetical protein TWF132_000792 [Orbilia oligospora]|nr:hypothetical protein TWF132_000792 [Orbilia oligospora]
MDGRQQEFSVDGKEGDFGERVPSYRWGEKEGKGKTSNDIDDDIDVASDGDEADRIGKKGATALLLK